MPTFSNAPYTKVSLSQMLKAVHWCQNALNLRDWMINLEFGDTLPDWVQSDEIKGLAYNRVSLPYFTAWTWVSPDRCKENDVHPIEALCHEMLHVLFSNYKIERPHDERMVITLEYHLFQSWLSEQRKLKRRKDKIGREPIKQRLVEKHKYAS
jgi:hypothetical protein